MAKSTPNSLALYLRAIGAYPLLTKEQELELGRRIKDEGDEDAREQMINSNLRLVVSVAKTFNNGNHALPLEDLIAEGNLGLVTAVDKYDYNYGYRFSTCAVPWIKQAIMKAIIDKSRTIRIPAHIVQSFNRYRDALESLAMKENHNPTHADIAKEMGIEVSDVEDILRWKQNTTSFETPLGDEEGNTLEDVLADTDDESPVEYAEKQFRRNFIETKLLAGLDERTRQIFKLRFGLGNENDPEEYRIEHTLEEIGEIIVPHITRERVRQIVTKQISAWKIQFGDNFDF